MQDTDTPPTDPGAPPPTSEPRRLTRDTDASWIGGVCAGLARYLGVDPIIVRLAVIVAVFIGGVGVLVYVLAWVLVPGDDGTNPTPAAGPLGGADTSGATVLGVVLAVLGGIWLLARFDDVVDVPVVPFLLLGLGAFLLWGRRPGDEPGPTMDDGPRPQWAPAPPPAGDDRDAVSGPVAPTTALDGPTEVGPAAPTDSRADALAPTAWTPTPSAPFGPTDPPGRSGSIAATPPAPRRRRDRGRDWAVVLGATLVAAGIAGVALLAVGGDAGSTVLGVAVVGAGLAVVVTAVTGRRAARLVPAAGLLLLATATDAVIQVPLDGGTGDPVVAIGPGGPDDSTRLGAGVLTLDLREVGPGQGPDGVVEASVGAGELLVEVPPALTVQVEAAVGIGVITTPDGEVGGISRERTLCWAADDPDPTRGPCADEPDVRLDLGVGLGNLELLRG